MRPHAQALATPALAVLSVTAGLVLAGCAKTGSPVRIPNEPPRIGVTYAPIQGDTTYYSVRIHWVGSDTDGQVVRYDYAEDPVPGQDTAWVRTARSEVTIFWRSPDPTMPLPNLGSPILSRGYHTFAIRAIDNNGARSALATRSFTSRTIAPSTQIERPRPTRQQPASTTPSVTISWRGDDPDGEARQTPVRYAWKVVPAYEIQPDNPEGITDARVQDYFGQFADDRFADWGSLSGDTTSVVLDGLTPQTRYYFAVVAFDEAGAFEPRFHMDYNVLQFRPTLDKLGPSITVWNEYFFRTQRIGGISVAPSRFFDLEVPADAAITLNWIGAPPAGAVLTGYRWCLDIANGDILDETPRQDDDDFAHWSAWSLNETSCTIGPFAGSVDSLVLHNWYLEARDNLGFITLFPMRIRIVEPRFDRGLLVVDDLFGTASPRPFRFLGPYPMEAEQDSFHFARGGFPDSMQIQGGGDPGAMSEPGIFSDFEGDIFDFASSPLRTVPLSLLSRYRVVAWYTDMTSAGRKGEKFRVLLPGTALRQINSVSELNTLAVYLRQGRGGRGNLWLFGDGVTAAIANGFYTRVSEREPRVPYTAGDQPTDVLRPGNFLYDFVHLRSDVGIGNSDLSAFTRGERLVGAIPHLPQFACPPGTSCPPDRSCDHRIGPSAVRTAVLWNDLPRLTLAGCRGADADPMLRNFAKVAYVDQPLHQPDLDTLYLYQALTCDPAGRNRPDGKPTALHYHGDEHGAVVWMGFPLYVFEREQGRQVVRSTLRNLGLGEVPPGRAGMVKITGAEERGSVMAGR